MIPDAKLEPDDVYEDDLPEVWEIQCPERITNSAQIDCLESMNREELLKHYQLHHKEYQYDRISDLETYFDHERTRRYGR
jgi:hypothetical protein